MMSALLSRHEKSFFQRQVGRNKETHNQTLGREEKTLKHSTINGMSLYNPSPFGTEDHVEEEAESV